MPPGFDRRVNEGLLAALELGGWAHELVLYGTSRMWGLDLQLRATPGAAPRATLYVGTTKVLDLYVDDRDNVRLNAAAVYRARPSWRSTWERRHRAADLSSEWPAVRRYLEDVIDHIVTNGKYMKEGIVQAAIGNADETPWTVIDREAVITFADNRERGRVLDESSRELMAAAERADAPRWWSRPRLSTECDLLAIDDDGQLLAIEVKPHTAGASELAWSGVQARQYANLFQLWVDVDRDHAATTLAETIAQRRRIGTLRRPVPNLALDLPVRPVVAFDARVGPSSTGRRRLREVTEHYEKVGLALGVGFFAVDLIGRITPVKV